MAAIRRASPSTARHTTAAARASAIHGTLVAVHRAARVGDLALDDGTLTALRFASAFQASGAQVGARLVVTVATPGSARPLVQALHVTGRATTVRLRGVVARVLPRESIEILGTHGAAVIVQLDGASGLTTLRPGARYSARTEDRPAIVLSGSEVDLHLRIGATGALAVRQARLVHAHVGRIEVEGIVKATNPRAGTITIENEDGERTVVAVGAQARAYYVGEQAEASGIPSGTHVTATRTRGDGGSDRHGNQGGLQGTPGASGDGRHGGDGAGCDYSCPATPPAETATATAGTQHGAFGGSGDDHHGGGATGCYYTCPPTATAGQTATAAPSGDDNHHGGGGATGCYYACPATPAASATATAAATSSGDDSHNGGGSSGCYYTCPPTPTTGAAAVPTATAATSDDNGHNGGAAGCYYTCPATPTSTSTAEASIPTATATSDDNHGGGAGCYYACPPTAIGTAAAPSPTSTPTHDENQRGKPTPTSY